MTKSTQKKNKRSNAKAIKVTYSDPRSASYTQQVGATGGLAQRALPSRNHNQQQQVRNARQQVKPRSTSHAISTKKGGKYGNSMRDSAVDYFATLVDPFDYDICAKIPDTQCMPTATCVIQFDGNFGTNSSGTGGIQIELYNGIANSAGINAGVAYLTEATGTTDSAITYNSVAFPTGAATLASQASMCRVVSAGLRVWSEQAPNVDGGGMIAWVVSRSNAVAYTSVTTALQSAMALRTRACDGIQVCYRPQDYDDWNFGQANSSGSNVFGQELYAHVTGGVASSSYQFSFIAHFEYVPAVETFSAVTAQSPIDSIGFGRALDAIQKVPAIMDANSVNKNLGNLLMDGVDYVLTGASSALGPLGSMAYQAAKSFFMMY